MKTLLLLLNFALAVAIHAQLPTTSPARAGFDPARLEILHAITKRFVDEGQHAGAITLLALAAVPLLLLIDGVPLPGPRAQSA